MPVSVSNSTYQGRFFAPRVPVETVVFRVIQEAINNVQKHSNASRAVLQLRRNKRSITGSVVDNGKGFDFDACSPGSHGLLSMSARVRALGGKVLVSSEPNHGTHVQFDVPFQET